MKRALIAAAAAALLGTLSPSPAAQEPEAPPPTIAVLGSSVAAGWVTARKTRQDLGNGWAQRLGRAVAPRGFQLANVSVPGDDTRAVLERIDRDLVSLHPRYVIVGLSMSNEGLEREDPEEVFARYEEGLAEILRIAREEGILPIVGLCYPNDNYTEEQYATLQRMNLALQEWDVPSIDFLGPLDDGHGNFVAGCTFDLDHPDDLGHQEMFHAIVPGLFESLAAGKPRPTRAEPGGETVVERPGDAAPIHFVPEAVMHSFTMTFELRTDSAGVVAALDAGELDGAIGLDGDGRLRYVRGEQLLTGESKIADGAWHQVILTHRHLLGESELWVDGQSLGKLAERVVPRRFVLGGPGGIAKGSAPASAAYRELLIHRTALSSRAAQALHEGALLQASLEVYAPLRAAQPEPGGALENRAQSTAAVRTFPGDVAEGLARLEALIALADAAPRWIDPDGRVPITLESDTLQRYDGEYEVNPDLALFVTFEGGRLIVSPNGEGKTELHPLSETEFFVRVRGPGDVPVVFVLGDEGAVIEVLFDEGPYQLRGRRVD